MGAFSVIIVESNIIWHERIVKVVNAQFTLCPNRGTLV